ncbi:MAG: MNIO family bufferin maturase [Gammaproteobacteria bacterium]
MEKSFLGYGLGLRTEHYETILNTQPAIDWFEVITENYLVPGGKPHYYLEKIRENYPIVMHGVSMSIGSSDPLDWKYLNEVKCLANKIEPKWISDHLCWTGIQGKNTHDLLPLPYSEETIQHVVDRITQIQDFFQQRILIENVSSYVSYKQSTLSEWDFLKEISNRADCLILLDINNIYVSSVNHEFQPETYLATLPKNRIQQIHLAGHSNMGDYIIDTHDHDIIDPVWNLYASALEKYGLVSTMIERDDNIPSLSTLITELNQAKKIADSVLMEAEA